MTEPLLTLAPWIALTTGMFALVVTAWSGLRAWRTWQRTRVTQEAASALVDVHARRLDDSIQQFDERFGTIADDGELLANALGELRADAAHLRWMLGRIPHERERLRHELLELVLPTSAPGEPVPAGDDDA